MKKFAFTLTAFLMLGAAGTAQVPQAAAIAILKAEDARRYDQGLATLLSSRSAAVRKRAALAAGRIGNEQAIPALASLLASDASDDVRAMAAFALGEIESIKAADAVLAALKPEPRVAPGVADVRARAVEAAGKIAAANAKDPKSAALSRAILEVLNVEDQRAKLQDTGTVRAALTAVLRARPTGSDIVVANFLTNYDPRVRSDAANTLARLKSKAAAETLRKMVATDTEPTARANAARALGNIADKQALNELLSAAIDDKDGRVRVSAIRALSGVGDARAAKHLLERGKMLLGNYAVQKTKNRQDKSEALEIAAALGHPLENTNEAEGARFLTELAKWGGYRDPEPLIGLAHLSPAAMIGLDLPAGLGYRDWRVASAYSQGLAAVGALKDEAFSMTAAKKLSTFINGMTEGVSPSERREMVKSMPDLTRALAALKPGNLNEFLRGQLANNDIFIRTAAVELIAEQPYSEENVDALNNEFDHAWKNDIPYNDAILATMDALQKLDKQGKRGSMAAIILATSSPDQLVRMKALSILKDDEYKNRREIQDLLGSTAAVKLAEVRPYTGKGTKMGQILASDADYRRALSRKNGTVKAVIATQKGTFTIDFFPEDAPLTVDNFIKLARSGYFNGVEVHRVVPNFVMQDGDPRGDGNGGPGWSIRCEINMLPYDRGAVGMALSGKDTGGSQWFVTHSPQPHLDGGYTVFGHVNETDMKVVDVIDRGDRILSVKIIGK